MTCNNAVDWSARPTRALDDMTVRVNFRWESLQSFLLYLFTYEMPLDKVRALVGKIETDALAEFVHLRHAGERQTICLELLERLGRIEESTVKRTQAAELQREMVALKDRQQQSADSRQQTADSPEVPDPSQEPRAKSQEPSSP
jgi:hypothetical protein